jgi:hypothetical protein
MESQTRVAKRGASFHKKAKSLSMPAPCYLCVITVAPMVWGTIT